MWEMFSFHVSITRTVSELVGARIQLLIEQWEEQTFELERNQSRKRNNGCSKEVQAQVSGTLLVLLSCKISSCYQQEMRSIENHGRNSISTGKTFLGIINELQIYPISCDDLQTRMQCTFLWRTHVNSWFWNSLWSKQSLTSETFAAQN